MKKDSSTLKCTYKYTDGTLCHRPLNRGYKDKEGEQYCIFHARNDEKLEELKKQMDSEISDKTSFFNKDMKTQKLSEGNETHKDKITELRRKYFLNYEGAYFPDGFDLFNNFVLEVCISFDQIMFSGIVDFQRATFKGEIIFSNAIFSNIAVFMNTIFNNETIFANAVFKGNANFMYSIFSGEVTFSEVIFENEVIFFETKFAKLAGFTDIFFIEPAFFASCELDKCKMKFLDSTFFSTSSFYDIREGSNITFINCCFSSVSFLRSRIVDTIFSNCCFNLTEEWINKKIWKTKDEIKSGWNSENDIKKRNQKLIFLKQEKDKIDDSKGRNKRLQKQNLLLEHRDFLKQHHFRLFMRKSSKRGLKIASAPLLFLFPRKFKSIRKKVSSLEEVPKLFDFGEVRDNYMQLKVNMDRMKDYDLANDFYYGEMEMKRLGEKWYKPKRWFLALYKTLSGYGNVPVRAVIMFFALIWIFSFPLFFMKLGIKDLSSQNKNQVSQRIVRLEPGFFGNFGEIASLSLYNMTALSNLTRSPYEPLNKWTFYYVSVVQYFIRPVQIALFILAIRRKVKRGEE